MVLAVACAICCFPSCLAGEGVGHVDRAVPAQSETESRHYIVELPPFGQDARDGEQSLRVSMGLQSERTILVVGL